MRSNSASFPLGGMSIENPSASEACEDNSNAAGDLNCNDAHPLISKQWGSRSYDVIRNFRANKKFTAMYSQGGKKSSKIPFNKHTFVKLGNEYLAANRCKEKYMQRRKIENLANNILMPHVNEIRHVALFKEDHFMMEEKSCKVISVAYDEQRNFLLQHGYIDIKVDHYDSPGIEALRARLAPTLTEQQVMPPRLSEQGVPLETVLPDMTAKTNGAMHNLYISKNEKGKKETIATALVRAFEEVVIVDDKFFSPYRLWTLNARKEAGMTSSAGMWLKRCKAYWMVKQILGGKHIIDGSSSPANSTEHIVLSFTQLEKLATTVRADTVQDGATTNWTDLAFHECSSMNN